MSRIILLAYFLCQVTYGQFLPPTQSGEVSGSLSTQFNWIYKDNFLTVLNSTSKLVESDTLRPLTNQSFESPTDGEGWTYTPSGADVVEAELTDVIDGARAAKITPAAETFTFEQTVNVDKFNGSTVGFKVWVKADFAIEACFLQGASEGMCEPYTGTNQWQEILLVGNVTTGTVVGVRFKSDIAVTGTALFDFVRFKVNPLTPTDIYASSEWKEYTPVTQALDPSFVRFLWRRVGDSIIIKGDLTTGSTTTSEAQIGLPSGLVIDSNKLPFVTAVNTTSQENQAGTDFFPVLATGGDTYLNIGLRNGGTAGGLTPQNGNNIYGAGRQINFITNPIPIAGWSNTSQGVVVKNRTDSSGVENRITTVFDSSGNIVSETLPGAMTATQFTTGTYDIDYSSLNLTVPPAIRVKALGGQNRDGQTDPVNTTTTARIYTVITTTAGLENNFFSVTLTKQDADYIKETDKVYTVPVSDLIGNFVYAQDNNGAAIAADTTDINFTEIVDSAGAWDGASYVVQKTGSEVTINGIAFFTTSSGDAIELYVNGSVFRRVSDTASSSNHPINAKIKGLSAGDVLTFRYTASTNLSSGIPKLHNITITEEYGQQGVYLGTFGQPTCYLKDIKPSGTNGGTATAGIFQTRELNTASGSCSFVSLLSNQITVEKGTYYWDCEAPSQYVGSSKAKLRNITDSLDSLFGSSSYADTAGAGDGSNVVSRILGSVTITNQKVFEVQHDVQTTIATVGFGIANSLGDEIYTQCAITKVR